MKTKDVIIQYKTFFDNKEDNKAEDLIIEFFKFLLSDIKTLFKNRKPSNGSSILSVFKEVESRWIAFCNHVDHFSSSKNYFREFVQGEDPKIYKFWIMMENDKNHSKEKYLIGKEAGLLHF
jgi:hypothetical protein